MIFRTIIPDSSKQMTRIDNEKSQEAESLSCKDSLRGTFEKFCSGVTMFAAHVRPINLLFQRDKWAAYPTIKAFEYLLTALHLTSVDYHDLRMEKVDLDKRRRSLYISVFHIFMSIRFALLIFFFDDSLVAKCLGQVFFFLKAPGICLLVALVFLGVQALGDRFNIYYHEDKGRLQFLTDFRDLPNGRYDPYLGQKGYKDFRERLFLSLYFSKIFAEGVVMAPGAVGAFLTIYQLVFIEEHPFHWIAVYLFWLILTVVYLFYIGHDIFIVTTLWFTSVLYLTMRAKSLRKRLEHLGSSLKKSSTTPTLTHRLIVLYYNDLGDIIRKMFSYWHVSQYIMVHVNYTSNPILGVLVYTVVFADLESIQFKLLMIGISLQAAFFSLFFMTQAANFRTACYSLYPVLHDIQVNSFIRSEDRRTIQKMIEDVGNEKKPMAMYVWNLYPIGPKNIGKVSPSFAFFLLITHFVIAVRLDIHSSLHAPRRLWQRYDRITRINILDYSQKTSRQSRKNENMSHQQVFFILQDKH